MLTIEQRLVNLEAMNAANLFIISSLLAATPEKQILLATLRAVRDSGAANLPYGTLLSDAQQEAVLVLIDEKIKSVEKEIARPV
jgi:hypothetical protein